MKNRRVLIVTASICLALVIFMLPLASACGPKEPTLKIGLMTPTTGAAAEKGAPMGHANLDCIKYINEELGGVGGYQIEAVWLDSKYEAAQSVANIKKFIDDGCLMFSTASSTEMGYVMDIANREGFPGLVAFSSPINYRPPAHVYGQMPDYGDDWLVFANYYLDNIWEGTGKPKMAMHLLDNPTGKGALDAATAFADELGIEIVDVEEHSKTATSVMDSMVRIRAANPDVLYISSTPNPTALIVGTAYDLGMYPGITIGCGHASFTKAFVDIAGADIAEGVYGVFPTVNWSDDVPAMAKMTEYCLSEHPDDYENMDYITCWAQSLIMAEILRLALDAVGYDVLAKGDAAAWQAIETYGIQALQDYDVGGLHGPVSYTPGDNRLSKSVRLFQVQGGNIVPLTDWIDAPCVEYENFDWWGQ